MHIRHSLFLFLLPALLLFALIGCGGTDIPTSPTSGLSLERAATDSTNNHNLLGLWQFMIDPENETLDVVPLRTCDVHMNGLAFMEPPAGVALAIDQIVDFGPDEITVDLALTHPYAGADFATAFDVCGILISHGSFYFPLSDTLFFPGDDDVHLVNPDGFTRWWNPVEFPMNIAKPHQGYIDGLLGKPLSVAGFDATLNGYKYFSTDLDDPEASLDELDTERRGVFEAGTSCVRRYTIGFAPGSLVFNYAVDANWSPAEGDPPFDIPDDFPASANRPEAYRIDITNVNNTLGWDTGAQMAVGSLSMSVYIYDWFEPENNMCCAYPQNEELMGYCSPFPSDFGDDWAMFDFDLWPMMMNSADDILIWIGVDNDLSDYQGALPFELQTAYFQAVFEVEEL